VSIIIQATEDGSETCFNSYYNQAYHSKFGAYREALEKHVIACKLPELATTTKTIRILDLCFGLGYNSFVAIDELTKRNQKLNIEITGLENDYKILEKIIDCKMPDSLKSYQSSFNSLIQKTPHQKIQFNELIFLELILGDARDTIATLSSDHFDAIFFDPFSPSVCPELWSESFIKDTVNTAKKGAYISTYSSARIVKDNFSKAGCEIFEGPLCGRRTGGVLAKKC
jgi:tRNA U34 5-methylaminomethyl-2-thiouridine-forming methyltransferase MnmC